MMGSGKLGIPGAYGFPIAVHGWRGPCLWRGQADRVPRPNGRQRRLCRMASDHGRALERTDARSSPRRWLAPASPRLLLSVVLFGTLPLSFFPPQNDDFSRVNITLAPGTTLKQTEAVIDRVAAIVEKDPSVERVFERVNVGDGRVNIVLKKDRKVTSTEFERALTPNARGDPRCARQLPEPERRRPGRGFARHHALSRRRRSSQLLQSVANEIAKEMATVPGLRRAARRKQPRPARNHDQAAVRPRRRPWRDHRRAEPDDPHRDAWRHRAEQRQILAVATARCRSPFRCRRMRAATSPTLENLPVPTSNGGSVPLKAVAEIGFGSGPTTISARTSFAGCRSAPTSPRALSRATSGPRSTQLPTVQEPAAGRSADESRQPEMAGRAAVQLRASRWSRACCWCSRCWCCSTAASWRRSSTWARCCWRRSAPRSRCTSPASRCRCSC